MRNLVHPSQIYPALKALLDLPDNCVSFELRVHPGQHGVIVLRALRRPGHARPHAIEQCVQQSPSDRVRAAASQG